MPFSPAYAEDLASPVVEVYAEAERILLARIAESLAQGITVPGWAERKLLEVQLLQRRTAADLVGANAVATAHMAAGVARAWNRGTAGAELDVARSVIGGLRTAVPLQHSLEAITAEATQSLQAVHQRTLRAIPDLYREVIRASAPQVLVGTQTVKQAVQASLDKFAERGITGFTDARGRSWALDSYVEMATRTATARAVVDGHVARLAEKGYSLVMVSDAPQECALCRPFEGKVFAITAAGLGEHASMTLDQARALGLFHANCRHSTALYQPGITKLPHDTADPEGNAARVKLRRLEAQLRAARRQEAVALDPAAKRVAQAKIRAKQAQIREHVATTPAKRRPDREVLRRPNTVKADPFARDTDEQLQDRLMAEWSKDKPDDEVIARLGVEMDLREKYAGSDLSEHYRRRNTALDGSFGTDSDEDITQMIEEAVASGDPGAAYFVDAAHKELAARTYAGKNVHRPVAKRVPKPRAESRAAKIRRAREEYDTNYEVEKIALENATNGNLIRRDREAEWRKKHGGDPIRLMLEGDPTTVYRYASQEVRDYFETHPRRLFDDYVLELLGEDPKLEEKVTRRRRRELDAARRAEERRR